MTPDIQYEEARRRARSLLGVHADIERLKPAPGQSPTAFIPFPCRVGVWLTEGNKHRFVYVGMGSTWLEALEDARKRQKDEP